MAAKTGKPVRVEPHMSNGPDFEIQEPAPGALLVVCGECGFQWDADHTVIDANGKDGGYECARCTLTAACAAMGGNTERLEVAAQAINTLANVQPELAHLRTQNALLRKESVALRLAANALEAEALGQIQEGGPVAYDHAHWVILLNFAKAALGDEARQ